MATEPGRAARSGAGGEAYTPLAAVSEPTFVIRSMAVCPFCEGGFTRNDPPMHYGKRETDGRVTTDSYQGVAHRMCIKQATPIRTGANAVGGTVR